MTALVSEVAVAITLQGKTVQALGTIVKSLLCSAGCRGMLDGHLNAGTYGAHEGVHHEKIWKVKIDLWDLIPDRLISGNFFGRMDKFIVYLQIYQQATDIFFTSKKWEKKRERNIHRERKIVDPRSTREFSRQHLSLALENIGSLNVNQGARIMDVKHTENATRELLAMDYCSWY